VDESRNKKIEGSGLGLSIVKNFVELHDGTIDIESEFDKGTIVSVCI
jgi:signal transduction histidine kinase